MFHTNRHFDVTTLSAGLSVSMDVDSSVSSITSIPTSGSTDGTFSGSANGSFSGSANGKFSGSRNGTFSGLHSGSSDQTNEEVIKIFMYTQFVLLCFGLFGNFSTMAILTRKTLRGHSFSLYLITLSISDSFVLILYVAPRLFEYFTNVTVVTYLNGNIWECKFYNFIYQAFFIASSWLIVAVTSERFFVILFPHKFKALCTYNIAIIVISCILLISFSINIFHFFVHEILVIKYPGIELKFCVPKLELQKYGPYWSIAVSLAYSIVPSALIIMFNVSIMLKIKDSFRFKRSSTIEQDSDDNKETRITFMLLCISTFFIITTLPNCIYILYYSVFRDSEGKSAYQLDNPSFAIVSIISTLNHGGNFYLYVLTGTRFRNELMKMLHCKPCTIEQRQELYETKGKMSRDTRSPASSAASTDKSRISTSI